MDANLADVLGNLGLGLLGLLGLGLVALGAFLRTKIKQQYLAGVQYRFFVAVSTAVKAVGQTFVANLKDTNADGKLSGDEAKAAKDAAVAEVKSYLGAKGLGELAKVFGGDADALVSGAVEAAVADQKLDALAAKK